MNDIQGQISVIFSGGPMNGQLIRLPWCYEYRIESLDGPSFLALTGKEDPPPIKTGFYKNTGSLNPDLYFIFEWQGWS